jgi:hypothetical protein
MEKAICVESTASQQVIHLHSENHETISGDQGGKKIESSESSKENPVTFS